MSPPSRIGRLAVERSIGAGGFATVWLAHDPQLDSRVAVKLLAENWAQDADVRRRFVDEARLLRRVDSDHLVRVYDLGELPDGRPWFVMTYADRGNLAERLATRPPPWSAADVLGVVDAIAAGLAVLHGHGVVHRDLKPRNVLLRSTPEGGERVLLGDLGIAKDLRWASGITMPAGSDGFMAPEQRSYSADIGPATDVHALAMTAALLLGLAPPWPAGPVGTALARATATDPGERTASAPAFAAQLRSALSVPAPAPPAPASGGPASGGPAPRTAPPGAGARAARDVPTEVLRDAATHVGPPARGGRRGLLLGAAAALVAVLAAVAGWTVLHREDTLSAGDGRVRVSVPHGWARHPAAFPGTTDTTTGARADAGTRSVTVARTASEQAPRDVLALVAPAGCAAPSVRAVRVATWDGVAVDYPGCPDGTVDEVVLAVTGDAPSTVWLEVRSHGGTPDVAHVLSSLDVRS